MAGNRADSPLSISTEQLSFLGMFVLFLAFYSVTKGGPTPFVSHVHQAYAFLQGHLWVVSPGYFEEVQSHGHAYLLDPPLSPIVLLPFSRYRGWPRTNRRPKSPSGR